MLCVAVLTRLDLLELDYPSGLWLWLAAVYPLISGPSHSVECECISFHLLLNYVSFLSYYYFSKIIYLDLSPYSGLLVLVRHHL